MRVYACIHEYINKIKFETIMEAKKQIQDFLLFIYSISCVLFKINIITISLRDILILKVNYVINN